LVFHETVMVRVKSTAHLRDDDEGRDSVGLAGQIKLTHASDAGSHNCAEGNSDEGSRTHSYYFGPSTMIVSHIPEMTDRGYFSKCSAHTLGEEIILEPENDKAVVFEEFFTAGLSMPPHPALVDILLKFRVQLHQLTPNTIGQLSKYVWALVSLKGVPSTDGFSKRYELHYQPKN
jgi:hypothetical protein